MPNRNLPVQVLSSCNTDGQLQPLRFRFEDSEHQLHTVHITEIIDSRFVEYVGIETFVFLCKALLEGAESSTSCATPSAPTAGRSFGRSTDGRACLVPH